MNEILIFEGLVWHCFERIFFWAQMKYITNMIEFYLRFLFAFATQADS